MSKDDLFPLAIDHVYIWVTKDAPEAMHIRSFGLHLLNDVTNHTGQGTSSRFFIFKNMYLELIWVSDIAALLRQSVAVGIDLAPPEHWQETGVSPFGVGFHYKVGSQRSLSIPTRPHRAEWMPPSAAIHMIPKSSVYEPAYFILSDELAYTEPFEAESNHPLGIQRLTQLCITIANGDNLSPMTQLLTQNRALRIETGSSPLMKLIFDDGAQGLSLDCRPMLPLIVQY